MTRKHFQLIADAMKATMPIRGEQMPASIVNHNCRMAQWKNDCKAMADVCQSMNSNFDRTRFLSACGIE